MFGLTWLKAAPWIIIAFLVLALGTVTNAYLGKRDELATFTAQVAAEGKKAKKDLEDAKKFSETTLKRLKDENENLIPQIRKDAVANYIATHPAKRVRVPTCPVGGGVPTDTNSVQVDDATVEEQIFDEPALDGAFIEECAIDSAKVTTWQQWCRDHRCPVEVQ